MSTRTERLIDRACGYWESGCVIPLDLFAQMNEAGLDVEALEDKHFSDED